MVVILKKSIRLSLTKMPTIPMVQSQKNEVQAFYKNPFILQTLTVSNDTHRFLSNNLGIKDHSLSRIINAIETMFDYNKVHSKKQLMHWMPRKNESCRCH